MREERGNADCLGGRSRSHTAHDCRACCYGNVRSLTSLWYALCARVCVTWGSDPQADRSYDRHMVRGGWTSRKVIVIHIVWGNQWNCLCSHRELWHSNSNFTDRTISMTAEALPWFKTASLDPDLRHIFCQHSDGFGGLGGFGHGRTNQSAAVHLD